MPRRTILLVEDDPDHATLTLRALRQHTSVEQVVVAADGIQALDYLFSTGQYADRRPGSLPDVVLLDLKLPRIGGLETLQRIRNDERTRHLPVVVLTSSDEERDRIESYRLGSNSYVIKPVDSGKFQEAARLLGLYWVDLNEPPPQG